MSRFAKGQWFFNLGDLGDLGERVDLTGSRSMVCIFCKGV